MMWRVVLRRKRYPQGVSSRDKLTWLLMPRAGAREAPGDAKSNNELKWCCNQRILKLVDCKIYDNLTSGKSIQSQSTTTQGNCGLILDWFTMSWGVIDFAIHQLSGPLIHIPVWYINNFTIIKTLKIQTFALECKIDPSKMFLECKIGHSPIAELHL